MSEWWSCPGRFRYFNGKFKPNNSIPPAFLRTFAAAFEIYRADVQLADFHSDINSCAVSIYFRGNAHGMFGWIGEARDYSINLS